MHIDLDSEPGREYYYGDTPDGETPAHQAGLRSLWKVHRDVDLDIWLQWVDELTAFDIPSYLRADVRLARRPLEGLELSLVGQNLLDPQHPEYEQFLTPSSEVQRSFYIKMTWEF